MRIMKHVVLKHNASFDSFSSWQRELILTLGSNVFVPQIHFSGAKRIYLALGLTDFEELAPSVVAVACGDAMLRLTINTSLKSTVTPLETTALSHTCISVQALLKKR